MSAKTAKAKKCTNCRAEKPVDEFASDRNEPDGRHSWCDNCRIALGKKLSDFRRLTVVGRTAQKTSTGEDLLTVLDSPIGDTVERLLDALAGVVESSSAARSQNLETVRNRPQHAPLPKFDAAWAETVQEQVDEQLWVLSENLNSFLNRPTDPKVWAACDNCGNKRIGEATFCHNCGERILEGARRCRADGCPNQGNRRSVCPLRFETMDGGWVPHPE